MASSALHASKAHPHCTTSVRHFFPRSHISVWVYLSAVSSVLARVPSFPAGQTPTHSSVLRSEVPSSIPTALLVTIFISTIHAVLLKSMLTSSSAVGSISAGTELWSSSVCASQQNITESVTLVNEQASLHIIRVYTSPIKGVMWPSGNSRKF